MVLTLLSDFLRIKRGSAVVLDSNSEWEEGEVPSADIADNQLQMPDLAPGSYDLLLADPQVALKNTGVEADIPVVLDLLRLEVRAGQSVAPVVLPFDRLYRLTLFDEHEQPAAGRPLRLGGDISGPVVSDAAGAIFLLEEPSERYESTPGLRVRTETVA